jgi:hypothetical protein
MCNTCNAYEAQSKLIDARKWFITNSTQKKKQTSTKKKLLKRLERSSLLLCQEIVRPVYIYIKPVSNRIMTLLYKKKSYPQNLQSV